MTVFIEIFRNRLGPMEIDNIKSSIDKYKCSCQRLNAPWEKPNLGHTWCNDTTENSLTLQVNCGALTSAVTEGVFPQAARRSGRLPVVTACFRTSCDVASRRFACIKMTDYNCQIDHDQNNNHLSASVRFWTQPVRSSRRDVEGVLIAFRLQSEFGTFPSK